MSATADNGGTVRTRTNTDGHYLLAPLVIGRYRVTIEATGFKRAVSESMEVHADSRARLDVQLELGEISDTLTIRPPAPLLQTDTSSLAYVLESGQIARLPANARNFQQLAVLAPGVLPAFGHFDAEAGFNSHGQWALQNNFILDGVDNNSHVMAMQDRKGQVLVPNLDAVQEFQIQTSNYTAEFGRGAGAVMNVSIKSGTNRVRGTAHEFLRNDAFDARDTFAYHNRTNDGKADPDELCQNQFGFTIGGPIRQNRTFYFGSVEFTKIQSTENSLAIVPSELERLGIFDPAAVIVRDPLTGTPFPGNTIPQARWDPVAARLLRLWPNQNFTDATRANFVSSPAHERARLQVDLRVDHAFSTRDRMFARVSLMNFRGERNGAFPPPAVGAGNNDVSRDDNNAFNLAASETHVFGASVVHESRLGINSLRTNKRPLARGFPNREFGLHIEGAEGLEGLSRISLSGSLPFTALGEALGDPDRTAGTFQLLDNLTVAKGAHTIKFGTDLRWIHSSVTNGVQSRGIFNFNGRFTGASLGDFSARHDEQPPVQHQASRRASRARLHVLPAR